MADSAQQGATLFSPYKLGKFNLSHRFVCPSSSFTDNCSNFYFYFFVMDLFTLCGHGEWVDFLFARTSLSSVKTERELLSINFSRAKDPSFEYFNELQWMVVVAGWYLHP